MYIGLSVKGNDVVLNVKIVIVLGSEVVVIYGNLVINVDKIMI